MTAPEPGAAVPGQAAVWEAWYAADKSGRTVEQDFSESKYDGMRRAFLAGTETRTLAAQQPQPAPGPCPGCESLRRQCSEIAGEVGILAGALTEIRDNDHPYGSYARDKARAALDVLHGLAPQPAPELAAYEADIASLADQRNRVSETADHLRELLDEIGVMSANAPEDGDSFGVLEEITMRIAAVDLPDTTPVLAAVKRERDAARADRAHLRAALATLTDRTEGSTVLTEDERAEYRKLVDAMGPFAPGRDGAAPELAAPVTGRTPGAAAAPELADVLSKRFFHLASELENEAPESDGSAVAQTTRAIARRIRKGLDE